MTASLLAAAGARQRAWRRGRLPGLRRWRLPAAVIAVVVIGLVVAVLLAPAAKTNTYLDPASGAADGSNALADLLAERGHQVVTAYSPDQALAALRSPAPGQPGTILVITSPDLLTGPQRQALAPAAADLLLVGPGPSALAQLAPAVSVASGHGTTLTAQPGCGLAAAAAAGAADVAAGYTYDPPVGAVGCYRRRGRPSVLRYVAGGRTITVVGSGTPLVNGLLADEGNAALMLNLLASWHRVVWLTPEPSLPAAPPGAPGSPAAGRAAAPGLIPHAVTLLLWQLAVAVLLAAIWRARRFGPLITERLPVVVRASETVEGHARLYQARRARDRAAAALREATLSGLLPALGMVPGAAPAAVAAAISERSRLSQDELMALLYGPEPASDAELVALARNLDELQKEVRSP